MTYQARPRDPLLETHMQEALQRRGLELLGLVMLGCAGALAAMLWSYAPEDPSWMAATDAPVHNWLGRVGAALASRMFVTIGWAAWGLPLFMAAWGMRYLFHSGGQRMPTRAIFAPIAVALGAVFLAAHVPPQGWPHSFGLGGLFGDTVLGAILTGTSITSAMGVKLLTLALGLLLVVLTLFVLGMDRAEARMGLRMMAVGVILTYAALASLLGRIVKSISILCAGLLRRLVQLASTVVRRGKTFPAEPEFEPGPTHHPVIQAQAGAGVHGHAEAQAGAHPVPGHGPALAERPFPPLTNGGAAGTIGIVARPALGAEAFAPGPAVGAAQPGAAHPGVAARGIASPGAAAGIDPAATRGNATAEPGAADRLRARIAAAIRKRQNAPATPPAPDIHQIPAASGGSGAPDVPPLAAARIPAAAPTAMSGLNGQVPPQPAATASATVSSAVVAEDGPLARPDPLILKSPLSPRPAMPDKPKVVHKKSRPTGPSSRAEAEAQPGLRFEEPPAQAFEPPPLSLLTNPRDIVRHHLSDAALEENARMLESVLDDYGVKGEIVSVRPGPVVTMYELEPAPGLKASRVIGLADDIARSMSALSARVSTIPGRSVIGIELPNERREKVVLREILAARGYGDSKLRLPLALGKDIGGGPVVADLAKMPHLLIAGTTGSGKSVAINTMILSLLYKLSPDDCRLIMIDPKMLELSVYDGIPHLLSPVVTDPKKAVVALKWVVAEMEDRYRKMSKMGVRNIEGYNGRVRDTLARGEKFSRTVQTGFDDATGEPIFETEEFEPETLSYIVVIVDEMADLMMVAGREIEACIQRLAQMARASGIHLIMATQRPSVDVITGTIKANFPTRISFQVTSKIDSRTILGEQGAEQLLGMGDMLYMAGGGKITRVHAPFVSDEEVEEVVNYLKSFGPPEYQAGVVDGPDEAKESDIDLVLGLGGNTDGEDAIYDQAVQVVLKDRKCSTSYIQRKLAIGYNKAARLVERMEEEGLVSPANHVGKRDILVPEGQGE